MIKLTTALAISALFGASGALANGPVASEGRPFGTAVVAPAAPINDNIQELRDEGRTVQEAIHGSLADDSGDGDIRGHGKTDAPGQNK